MGRKVTRRGWLSLKACTVLYLVLNMKDTNNCITNEKRSRERSSKTSLFVTFTQLGKAGVNLSHRNDPTQQLPVQHSVLMYYIEANSYSVCPLIYLYSDYRHTYGSTVFILRLGLYRLACHSPYIHVNVTQSVFFVFMLLVTLGFHCSNALT